MTSAMPTPPALRRLLPYPASTISVRAAYDVERPVHPDRPWVGLCMVTSLDGSISVGGGSGTLGNPNDLDILLTLRSLADVLIVGAGTVTGEGYGPPKKPGQRIGVVTNRGSVDLDSELFTSGAGFVIASEQTVIDDTRVDVLRAGHDRVDVAEAIGRLGELVPGVRYVQAEGGAGFNASLLDADVIDELDLTWSPHLVGGDGARLTNGASEALRRYTLAQLLADDEGFVFSRWLRAC